MKLSAKLVLLLTVSFLFTNCSAKEAPEISERGEHIEIADPDTAFFASGCFWCTEAIFERVKGVGEVVSGYSGGTKPDPTYKEVVAGRTEYAESVRVIYDSDIISFSELVEIFYGSHDPTQLNRQGPDIGKQYRSAIFYQTREQKKIAEEWKQRLNESGKYDNPVVTEISEFRSFYKAEDYHQDFYEKHPGNRYIYNVSRPKVEKFEKEFKHQLKKEYRKEI